MRLLPERMAALAVAGSVAWSYLPRTTAALVEIREAQMARGYRPRGIRDAAPLVIPLLAGGLERAMITAEALEARAFGAPLAPELTPHPWQVASLLGRSCRRADGRLLSRPGSADRCRGATGDGGGLAHGGAVHGERWQAAPAPHSLPRPCLGAAGVDRQRRRGRRPGGRDRGAISRSRRLPVRALSLVDGAGHQLCRCWRRSGCCWLPPRYDRERAGSLDAARGTNRHLLRADLPVPGA